MWFQQAVKQEVGSEVLDLSGDRKEINLTIYSENFNDSHIPVRDGANDILMFSDAADGDWFDENLKKTTAVKSCASSNSVNSQDPIPEDGFIDFERKLSLFGLDNRRQEIPKGLPIKIIDLPLDNAKLKYSCDQCAKAYTNQAILKRHVLLYHTMKEMPSFICYYCGKQFRERGSIITHISAYHSPEGKFKYPCKMCRKVYIYKGDLTRHEKRYHAPDGVIRYRCPKCEKLFTHTGHLNRHIKVIHLDGIKDENKKSCTSRQRFSCELCGKEYSHNGRLNEHLKYAHSPGGPIKFICHICGNKYADSSYMKFHMRAVHGNVDRPQKFKCDRCGKQYSRKHRLNTHFKIVHGPQDANLRKRHPCKICGKTYASSQVLNRHVKYYHTSAGDVRYNCEFCGSLFRAKGFLNYHIKKKHPSKSMYNCYYCRVKHFNRSKFKKHLILYHSYIIQRV